MSDRIALETLDAKPPFTPCAFAAGETADAPECSAQLVLSTCLDQFERESGRGVFDTGRYRMPYRIWGSGPALVWIPGLCDAASSFVLPLARLSRKYCCIVYDLPTGVDDGARLGSYLHDDLVTDLLGLSDHLRLGSAAVLGVSFGSTIALAAMAREPNRFPIGLTQGGFAWRPWLPRETALAKFARYWPGRIGQMPMARSVLARAYAAEFAALEPGRLQFLLRHHYDAPIAAVARRALMMNAIDLRPILPNIRQPVLMICGERDSIVNRACEETLRSGLPNVARAEIEGCGHLPQHTHPEVLCEVIEQFLTMATASHPHSKLP